MLGTVDGLARGKKTLRVTTVYCKSYYSSRTNVTSVVCARSALNSWPAGVPGSRFWLGGKMNENFETQSQRTTVYCPC